MVFPHHTIPTNPMVFNPCGFGNMVHRNVWNHTAQILREINRMTNQIHDNLIQPNADCSSSASASGSSACASSSSKSNVNSINGDTFEVKVQVEHFKPEEISVKLLDTNNLVIEGKHAERSDDHGFISRSFSRRYIIPDIYDIEKLESQLSLNGVLTIKAPRKPIQGSNGEKIIPITLTSNISSVDQTIDKPTSESIPVTMSTSRDDDNQTTIVEDSNQKESEASSKNN
ncbi:alpha-crystallin A chain-like [Panonychus citri]|uniref:alpha-crystallin A chain-like n=1 Tax=Panonychus citri TaxID=50023 RepID=UPI002307647E|nr:alpha-crystallin A chain-like [Panonychus citri]